MYAGGGSLGWNPLPLLLEETQRLLDRGFRALKIKIGHGPREDAEIVREIRGAAGPHVRIMVDANRAYDLAGALELCRVLEEQDISWFEEPFPYEDPGPWLALRERTTVRLAGGEGFARMSQAAEALRLGLVHVLQCDAGAFGLEALLAIASMAHEDGVALTPHSCNSAIGFGVSAHLQRALPNAEVQEFETFDSPFIHGIFEQPWTISSGRVALSEEPGLGLRFNGATLDRYARMAG